MYLGSSYVNDFNLFGRTYQVTAQADPAFRTSPSDLARIKVRNQDGDMVPLSAVTTVLKNGGADRVQRYNLYYSSDISGTVTPGVSSSQMIHRVEQLAQEHLPEGFTFAWTDLTYQQILAGQSINFIFPLCILFVFLVLHEIGAHYTYAEVPVDAWGERWLGVSPRELFGFERNHYDRLGHFMQGFVPAILARELLLRRTPLLRGPWLNYLVVAAALSFSAFFELIEWWAALVWGGDADAFLATQGDVWDTQWDMFLALCGAILALLLLGRRHDRQLGIG